jgi:hypothetical protein
MSIFKAPKAPDPMKTAQAQGAANTGTAIAQQLLNQTDQTTPWGSVDYSQTGTASYVDPLTGKTTKIPQFMQTTTLNAADQGLLDQERLFDKNANQIAIDQAGRAGAALSQPMNINNEAVEARLMELGRKRLDPAFGQQRADLDQKLANQGIAIGSEAYKRAMEYQGQKENDAYNQLLLQGRGRAVDEAIVERQTPINEMMALMGGQQVNQPQFSQTPQVGVQGVDYAGMVQNQYNQQMGARNAAFGALGGMAGTALGGWASNGFATSDRRAKKDVKKIGKLAEGLNAYSFKYKGDTSPFQQVGVMAQEAEKVAPESVAMGDDGYKKVHYGRLASAMAGRA